MKKNFIVLAIVLICVVLGCKSKDEKLKMKLTGVITSYMEENIDDFRVDSVSIMGIDSLTDLDFAYFQKIIFKNTESEILTNRILYLDPITDEEYDEQEKLQSQLQMIQNRIQFCDSILMDQRTDTTSVEYFFVATKIYGKGKGETIQIQEIGFPIDKNFVIKEIDIFN